MGFTLHLINLNRLSLFSRLTFFSLVIISFIAFNSSEAADHSSAPLPESPSPETFSLVSHLPAKLALDITGWYRPINENCKSADNFTDEPHERHMGQHFNVPPSHKPHSALRTIPLTYTVDACKFQLNEVTMKIRGRYGERHWQETYAPALLLTTRQGVSKREKVFDQNGVHKMDATCFWLFQESKIYFELSKSLSCITDKYTNLQHDQLNGKTIDLTIKISPMERPSARNKWIESDTSWKPCLGNEKSDRCQQPPQFKTFQMNGQTCTVYPGCTE